MAVDFRTHDCPECGREFPVEREYLTHLLRGRRLFCPDCRG